MNCIQAARHPLLHNLSNQADWAQEDSFPTQAEYADEVEAWLRFADKKQELSRFLPRLQRNAYQRDRTLAELGVAYFLEVRCSLPIIAWEPLGDAGKKGEYLISCAGQALFIEVKTGGWQKDIADAEGRESPRLKEPKYIQAEARSVGPWQVIRNAVSNAYPKFTNDMQNVLIIWDDYFIPLNPINASIALYCPRSGAYTEGYLAENGCFVDRQYERLGAVGILNVKLSGERITYDFSVYDNSNAIKAVRLDQSAFNGYPRYDESNRPN
jgi:hypothetical protein